MKVIFRLCCQIFSDTHIVIDETVLEEGQLDNNGKIRGNLLSGLRNLFWLKQGGYILSRYHSSDLHIISRISFLFRKGVQNIAAINHVISWQKLQYDFGFYKTDFFTNVVCLSATAWFLLRIYEKLLIFFIIDIVHQLPPLCVLSFLYNLCRLSLCCLKESHCYK